MKDSSIDKIVLENECGLFLTHFAHQSCRIAFESGLNKCLNYSTAYRIFWSNVIFLHYTVSVSTSIPLQRMIGKGKSNYLSISNYYFYLSSTLNLLWRLTDWKSQNCVLINSFFISVLFHYQHLFYLLFFLYFNIDFVTINTWEKYQILYYQLSSCYLCLSTILCRADCWEWSKTIM